jgi:hypothetical protein
MVEPICEFGSGSGTDLKNGTKRFLKFHDMQTITSQLQYCGHMAMNSTAPNAAGFGNARGCYNFQQLDHSRSQVPKKRKLNLENPAFLHQLAKIEMAHPAAAYPQPMKSTVGYECLSERKNCTVAAAGGWMTAARDLQLLEFKLQLNTSTAGAGHQECSTLNPHDHNGAGAADSNSALTSEHFQYLQAVDHESSLGSRYSSCKSDDEVVDTSSLTLDDSAAAAAHDPASTLLLTTSSVPVPHALGSDLDPARTGSVLGYDSDGDWLQLGISRSWTSKPSASAEMHNLGRITLQQPPKLQAVPNAAGPRRSTALGSKEQAQSVVHRWSPERLESTAGLQGVTDFSQTSPQIIGQAPLLKRAAAAGAQLQAVNDLWLTMESSSSRARHSMQQLPVHVHPASYGEHAATHIADQQHQAAGGSASHAACDERVMIITVPAHVEQESSAARRLHPSSRELVPCNIRTVQSGSCARELQLLGGNAQGSLAASCVLQLQKQRTNTGPAPDSSGPVALKGIMNTFDHEAGNYRRDFFIDCQLPPGSSSTRTSAEAPGLVTSSCPRMMQSEQAADHQRCHDIDHHVQSQGVVLPIIRRNRALYSSASEGGEIISSCDPGIWFKLQAEESNQSTSTLARPPLQQITRYYLRVKDENMPVSMVKKYLVQKLRLVEESEVQI